MSKYAVLVEIDFKEHQYISRIDPTEFSDTPLLFNTKQEAEEQALHWNTGRVVSILLPFTTEERLRSIERSIANRRS